MGNGNQEMENHKEMKLFPRSLTSSSAQQLFSFLSAKPFESTLSVPVGQTSTPQLAFPWTSVSSRDKLGLLSQSLHIQETEFNSAGTDVPLWSKHQREGGWAGLTIEDIYLSTIITKKKITVQMAAWWTPRFVKATRFSKGIILTSYHHSKEAQL